MKESMAEIYYGESAYRLRKCVPLKSQAPEQSVIFRMNWMVGKPLRSMPEPSDLFPPSFLNTWSTSDLREKTEADEEQELLERNNYHGRLDEECLKYATLPKSSWFFLLVQYGGRFGFLCFLPIYLITEFIMWFQISEYRQFNRFFFESAVPLFLFVVLPFLVCWVIGWLLEKCLPDVVYKPIKGPKWELNRRTGMVIIYYDPASEQSGEVRAQAPFSEWGGYILSLPDHQGNIWHRLVLVHQVHEWVLPLNKLLAPTTNKPDVFAYWDVIHQYMDVTQPLPDMPLFEPYRHLDPTTRKHDKDTGRDPNYWRNMDDETYEAFKIENSKRVWHYDWE